MTKALYSTSSADRCEAQNRLTCRKHGVAGDFTEVPKYVSDNIDRQRNLDEDYQDKRAAYLEYAKELGIKPADIDHVIQGVHPTSVGEDQVDGLINLYNEYTEAAQAADEESEQQHAEVAGFLDQRIKEVFPEGNAVQHEMIKQLVGLRFAADEQNLDLEAHPKEAGDFADIYRASAARRGWTRDDMFKIVGGSMNRKRLRELDRSYFTALSGRIPTELELDEVEGARQLRTAGPVDTLPKQEAAWELAIRLGSIE